MLFFSILVFLGATIFVLLLLAALMLEWPDPLCVYLEGNVTVFKDADSQRNVHRIRALIKKKKR